MKNPLLSAHLSYIDAPGAYMLYKWVVVDVVTQIETTLTNEALVEALHQSYFAKDVEHVFVADGIQYMWCFISQNMAESFIITDNTRISQLCRRRRKRVMDFDTSVAAIDDMLCVSG